LFEHADEEEEVNKAGDEQYNHSAKGRSGEVSLKCFEAVALGFPFSNVSEEPEVTGCADTLAVEIVLKNAENVVVVGNGVFEDLVS